MKRNQKNTKGDVLNGICPYYTMFPISYPLKCLEDAQTGDWVYDPFCGRGTTLFAARLKGINGVGIDLNPVAVAIAQAKLASTTPSRIINLARKILNSVESPNVPTGEFWDEAFHPNVLIDICKLRDGLQNIENDTANALRALMLGILHGPTNKIQKSYFSNQMPRTFASKPAYSVKFRRERKLVAPEIDTLALISRKAKHFFDNKPPKLKGFVKLRDARKPGRLQHKFKYIITSPPYFGMRTYKVDQWLRLWFLGHGEEIEYKDDKQVNHKTLISLTKDLSEVWKSCARNSTDDAVMHIRYGALPSKNQSPEDIIRTSITLSGMWEVVSVNDAGVPKKHLRQAAHMGEKASKTSYIEEIDVLCRRINV